MVQRLRRLSMNQQHNVGNKERKKSGRKAANRGKKEQEAFWGWGEYR